ncbi:unnamed protein product, partial [marine sediment metagenome]
GGVGAAEGGLVGFDWVPSGTITNCFWDTQTSGQATSDGGTGRTTIQMQTQATFTGAGWDFDTIWNICGSPTYVASYPWLQWQGALADICTPSLVIAPIANFSAQPLTGKYPLTVHFTDLSTGDPISWLWDFGDRAISREQNPAHIYKEAGFYTVSLTATNEAGSDTETKFAYIEAIERSFIEKRGIEEKQQMKIRHISLKRGLATAETIPIRVIEVRRDPAPKRIWK